MEMISRKILNGRNIYSHRPVQLMYVNTGRYYNISTKDILNFNDRLLTAFPNLKKHTCSLGYEGGFSERLNTGTFLSHVLEHLIIDMQNVIGYKVKYGKTISLSDDTDLVVFEFEDEECAIECSIDAIDIINSYVSNESIEVERILARLKALKEKNEPGLSTSSIINEAKKRNIPVVRLDSGNLYRLGYGKYSKLIQATLTQKSSCISTDICSDKSLTKKILEDIGIPVPYGYIAYDVISAIELASDISYPVTLKPLDANQGKGVNVNLTSDRQVRDAYYDASKYSSEVIVEKFIEGNDYRILVTGNKVSAVSQRLPALVIGDGTHTIDELISIENENPMRGDGHSKPLTKIKKDIETKRYLEYVGKKLEDIPQKDEVIKLRSNGNLSTGGTAIDCTDIIHPINAELAVRSAQALGMEIAGIDMIAPNISKSILKNGGAIIEVNAAPGVRMHTNPSSGKARDVGKDIVDTIFSDEGYSFKLVSVTGTNGKTTTVRLINHILQQSGEIVGMTNTTGTFINNKCVQKGDHSGPESARRLLSRPEITSAVLETARGGIIRAGLGYDLADVGVITNISEDHLGLDGVRDIQDLAHVKSLVAEAIKPNGYAVLNAEDEMTNKILNNIDNKIVYFYNDINNIKVKDVDKHINVYAEEGWIKIKDNGKTILVEKIDDIPVTFCGYSRCNLANCLAAVGSLYTLNIPVTDIASGLKTFTSNDGRFQIFDMNEYKILVDYAHNYAAYSEVIELCKKMGNTRLVGVIGVPGDRSDESAVKIGHLAANNFDVLYIKEDKDLRNRAKGEISSLLQNAVSTIENKSSFVIENEEKALKKAIENVEKGDLIVVFYEKLEPIVKLIKAELNSIKRNKKRGLNFNYDKTLISIPQSFTQIESTFV